MKAYLVQNQLKHLVQKGAIEPLVQKERAQIIRVAEKKAYAKFGISPHKNQLESIAIALNSIFPRWDKVNESFLRSRISRYFSSD